MRQPLELLAALVVAGLFYLFAYGDVATLFDAVDFNQDPFEDFMGPYLTMGRTLFESEQPVPGFLYGPFFALLLSPMRFVTPLTASWIWLALQVAAMLALLVIPLRWLGLSTRRARFVYALAMLLSFPVLHNLHWGQVSVLLAALTVASFELYSRGRRRLSACLLASAIAIKFYPALVLIYFLMRADYRYLATCAEACIVFMLVIPAVALGVGDSVQFYALVFERLSVLDAHSGAWQAALNQTTFAAVMARLVGPQTYVAWQVLGYVWTLASLACLLRLVRLVRSPGDHAMALCLFFLLTPLWVRPAWPHYFVYLPFCQALLFVRTRDARALQLAMAASWLLSSCLLFRYVGDHEQFARAGWLLWSDLIALAVATRCVFRAAPAQTPADTPPRSELGSSA